jgi:protein-tyrosine phosphatase
VAPPVDTPTLTNVFNFRDLGGLPTADGRRVRTGVVFRADGLHRLDDADVEALAPVGLRTVVDLRTDVERREHGICPTGLGAAVLHHPVIAELWPAEGADEAHPVDYLVERYLEMTVDLGAAAIAAVLRLTGSGADQLPLAFHCSAGKDRTGVTAAVLLAALGVPDDEITEDYHRTAGAMASFVEWLRAAHPEAVDAMADQPAVFLSCPPEAMGSFLVELRRRHGSVEGYVRSIGLSDDEVDGLRRRLID